MRKLILLLLLLSSVQIAYACDECGYYTGAAWPVWLSEPGKNTLSLRWYRRPFKARLPVSQLSPNGGKSPYDNIQNLELNGNFLIWKGIGTEFAVPLYFYTHAADVDIPNLTGFGDSRLYLHYNILDGSKLTAQKMFSDLRLGIGIKLPTGLNSPAEHDDKSELPHVQTGTGTSGLLLSGRYIGGWNNVIFAAQAEFQVNYKDKEGCRSGNRLIAGFRAGYKFSHNKFYVKPMLGWLYEKGSADQYLGSDIANTAWRKNALVSSLELAYSPFMLQLNYNYNFNEANPVRFTEASPRFEASLNYMF